MIEKNDLEWKTFSDHLSSTTKRLMETKELADVTLVTDDQKQVLAHKIFLSAGSEIFRNILINNPHKHPFIYLTNIIGINVWNVIINVQNVVKWRYTR